MGGQIGSVSFDNDLYWVSRWVPFGVDAKSASPNSSKSVVEEKTNLRGQRVQCVVDTCGDRLTAGTIGEYTTEDEVYGSTEAEEVHIFRVEWCTAAQLDRILTYARNGQSFTVKTASSGGVTIANCRFSESNPIQAKPVVPEDGFSHEQVCNTALDLYNAEFRIILVRP